MKLASRLLLLVAAVAAMSAAPAAADVVVTDEDSGEPCSEVSVVDHEVEGGCPFRAETSLLEIRVASGMSVCSNELEARIDGAGHGYAYDIVNGSCGGIWIPCEEGAGVVAPWPLRLISTTTMEATFCLKLTLGAFEIVCHVATIDFAQSSHESATFSVTHGDGCDGTVLWSVSATWTILADEDHPEFEVSEAAPRAASLATAIDGVRLGAAVLDHLGRILAGVNEDTEEGAALVARDAVAKVALPEPNGVRGVEIAQ